MAKIKTKTQTPAEKQAELSRMLAAAATSNHNEDASFGDDAAAQAQQPEPQQPEAQPRADVPTDNAPVEPTSGNEQKGKNETPVLPPAVELEPTPAPVLEVAPTPAIEPAPAPAPEPVAAVKPTPVPAPDAAPAISATAVSTAEPAPALLGVVEKEPASQVADAPAATTEAGDEETEEYDLATLFTPSAEKKTAQMRISDKHYQYLLMLGTIVGGGTGVPEMVHNIIAQFIRKRDKQIQKAIQKQLRKNQASIRP